MKIYKHKLLIPCVPIPYEWTVETNTADIMTAYRKARIELKNRKIGVVNLKYAPWPPAHKILSVREILN